jgi:hypothetical protein
VGDDDYVLQTTTTDQLSGCLKAFAALRVVPLLDIYVEALEFLFSEREAARKKHGAIVYLLAPRKARALNVRVPMKIAGHALAVAEEDDVPVRAVVYTALLFFALTKRLIEPAATVKSGILAIEDEDERRAVSATLREMRHQARARKK